MMIKCVCYDPKVTLMYAKEFGTPNKHICRPCTIINLVALHGPTFVFNNYYTTATCTCNVHVALSPYRNPKWMVSP